MTDLIPTVVVGASLIILALLIALAGGAQHLLDRANQAPRWGRKERKP